MSFFYINPLCLGTAHFLGNVTIAGNLEVTGTTTLINNTTTGKVIIDITDTEALLIRKDGDTGDLIAFNTTNNNMLITPGSGTIIDMVLETAWTTGTLLNADYGSAKTLTGNITGINLDFNTNVTALANADITGFSLKMPAFTQSTADTTLYYGITLPTAGALVQDTLVGTIIWRGINLQLPNQTQTTGNISTTGIYIAGGTVTSGTQYGAYISMVADVNPAIYVGKGQTVLNGLLSLYPQTTGNVLSISLETEWTTGYMVYGNFGSATTLTGGIAGFVFDANANVTPMNGGAVTGVIIKTPALTQTNNSTTNYIGFNLPTAGALVQNTLIGAINWMGTNIQMPDTTQTTGTVTAYGHKITGGTVTSGTVYGLYVDMVLNTESAVYVAQGKSVFNGLMEIAPQTTGSIIDIALETEWTSGRIINSNFGSSTTQTDDMWGSWLDWETNFTQISGKSIFGHFVTLPSFTDAAGTGASGQMGMYVGAQTLTSNHAAADITFDGLQVGMPAIVQTLGAVKAYGTRLQMDSVTTGGTYMGHYIYWDAAKTLGAGDIFGINFDANTNVTFSGGTDLTGYELKSPALTNSSALTSNIIGLNIPTAGALVQDTLAGTINFKGINIQLPNITQTTGTVNSYGLYINTGTVTSGIQYSIYTVGTLERLEYNALGANITRALELVNTTDAANGAQQYSPAIRLRGEAWETTGGTSQTVDWEIYGLSVQSTTARSTLTFGFSANGAATAARLSISSTGFITPYAGFTVPNGSAAGPSYTFTNDADSGLYLASDGNIGLAIAGTQIVNFAAATTTFSQMLAIAPITTGTVIDLALETEWTSGTLFNADYASPVTQTDHIYGTVLDFKTNLTPLANKVIFGNKVMLPVMTQATADIDTSYVGFMVDTYTLTQNTLAGAITLRNFYGEMPAIVQTTGTVTGYGVDITGGNMTAGNALFYNVSYGAGTTLSASTTYGMKFDANTNVTASVTAGTGFNIYGIDFKTPALTSSEAVTSNIIGFNLPTAGALVQNTLVGTINWTGANLVMPNQTQTTGTVLSKGLSITGGTVTSGSAYGLYVNMAANADNALYIEQGTSTFCGLINIAPQSIGNIIDIALETEWTSGTIFNANYASGTTQTDNLVGFGADFYTNLTPLSGKYIVGYGIFLPALTQSTADTTSFYGFSNGINGDLVQNTLGGTINWTSYDISHPAITQTTGTINLTGINQAGDNVTTGGTVTYNKMSYSSASTIGAGDVYGVYFDANTNVTMTGGADVKAFLFKSPVLTNAGGTSFIEGLSMSSVGALITNDASSLTLWMGANITMPTQTQTAGTLVSYGVAINGGTVNSGSAYGLFIDMVANTNNALYVAQGTSTFNGAIVQAPQATGTIYDIQLETEWTTGTILNADFGGATTQTGTIIGNYFDLKTNLTTIAGGIIVGQDIVLPALTQSTADTAFIFGSAIGGMAANGALIQNTLAGNILWSGFSVDFPAITQTTGLVQAKAHDVSGTTMTAGTLYFSNYRFAAATTLTAPTIYGLQFDANTNVTAAVSAAAGFNLRGFQFKTPALTSSEAVTSNIIGFDLPTAGALVQDTLVGTINWRGINLQLPNITQTTGTVTSYGMYINGGTVTSGTELAIFVDKGDVRLDGNLGDTTNRVLSGWFTDLTVTNAIAGSITGSAATLTTTRTIWGQNFNGSANVTGAFSGATTMNFTQGVTQAPTVTGILYDMQLETEWTTGTLFNADFGSATTQSGDMTGINLDFNANLAGVTNLDVTGMILKTPVLTQSSADTTTYIGWNLSTAGALVQDTLAGTIAWKGISLQMPNITQTTGTVTSHGLYINGGTVTSGTELAIFVDSGTSRFDGEVQLLAGQKVNVTTVGASTYDILATDYILNVTYSATGTCAIDLKTAQTIAGRVLVIKDAGGLAGTNNITITTEAAQTIDGAATKVINANYMSINLYCDGTNWFVF